MAYIRNYFPSSIATLRRKIPTTGSGRVDHAQAVAFRVSLNSLRNKLKFLLLGWHQCRLLPTLNGLLVRKHVNQAMNCNDFAALLMKRVRMLQSQLLVFTTSRILVWSKDFLSFDDGTGMFWRNFYFITNYLIFLIFRVFNDRINEICKQFRHTVFIRFEDFLEPCELQIVVRQRDRMETLSRDSISIMLKRLCEC